MRLPHVRTGVDFDSPVHAGDGWPGDPARPDTEVSATPARVRTAATRIGDVAELDALVSVCRACPRLVTWRERVAVEKRRAYATEPYWGRPVPGFGAARPSILVLGLAPAAHGANRTGRVFTGDRSGDFLFAAMYRAGLASAPDSVDSADGLMLNDTRVVAAVRCAPPDNKPLPAERSTCAPWLDAEWRLISPSVRVIVALGGFAWRVSLDMIRSSGGSVPSEPGCRRHRGEPQPKFGHLASVQLGTADGQVTLIGCYHPSQQNTFTGRLTPEMLDDVFTAANRVISAR